MDLLRVYLEDFVDGKAVWVVDEGDASTAKFFDCVCVHSFGITKSNLQADNKKEPRAWIEYRGSLELKVINNTAVIR